MQRKLIAVVYSQKRIDVTLKADFLEKKYFRSLGISINNVNEINVFRGLD